MNKFSEALTYVLANTNIKRENLTFPLTYSKAFGETSVREMDLSERAKNSLGRGNIHTMNDLMQNFDNIVRLRSCGKQTVKEIKNRFLQRWYETLDDEQKAAFWEEFIVANS